jgi:hypothetical protein
MSDWLYDLLSALRCALHMGRFEWVMRRHLRRGGCPDNIPF